MSFETEIWDVLLAKQPKLKDDNAQLKITAGALRKLLRQTYSIGRTIKQAPRGFTDNPFYNFFK